MKIDKTKIIVKIISTIQACLIAFFLVKYSDTLHNSMERMIVFLLGLATFIERVFIPFLPIIQHYLDGNHEDDRGSD